MRRRPPRSTQSRSSSASDVYKRQVQSDLEAEVRRLRDENRRLLMEREILKKAAAFFANEKN